MIVLLIIETIVTARATIILTDQCWRWWLILILSCSHLSLVNICEYWNQVFDPNHSPTNTDTFFPLSGSVSGENIKNPLKIHVSGLMINFQTVFLCGNGTWGKDRENSMSVSTLLHVSWLLLVDKCGDKAFTVFQKIIRADRWNFLAYLWISLWQQTLIQKYFKGVLLREIWR